MLGALLEVTYASVFSGDSRHDFARIVARAARVCGKHATPLCERRHKIEMDLTQTALSDPRIEVGNGCRRPSLRTRCAVLPRQALQLVVSASGLARQSVDFRHCENPQVGEEGIRPLFVIASALALTGIVPGGGLALDADRWDPLHARVLPADARTFTLIS